MSGESTGRAARLRAFLDEEPALGAGTFVSERVRLKEPIATGGMGTVWRAEHVTLGVDVAVKLLTDDVRDDPDALTRFQNEASTASRLASTHVVKILDFGLFQADTPYLVMEHLDGEDLASLITREGPRSPREVADIVTQAARGLTAAHEVGFIHRDVKPQNLFLAKADGQAVVKLLDFGVARRPIVAQTTTTKSGQLLGTPLYMGPEQLTSPGDIDARADLWSLAVVAYEALTGERPFKGETVGALAIAVDRGRFTKPSSLNASVGPSLDAWFERAFAKAAADRFATASELATTFEAALMPARSRKPWLFAAAFLCAAGTAVVAVASARTGSTAVTVAASETATQASSSGSGPLLADTSRPQVPGSADRVEQADPLPSVAPPVRKTATKPAPSMGTPVGDAPSALPAASEKPRKDRGF